MPLTGQMVKQLDDKQCFDLWLELGTLQKVANRLEKDGEVNEITGKPFTLMGIRVAALRYLIYNPNKAKERMIKSDPNSEYVQTEYSWKLFLTKRAVEVLAKRNSERVFRWAKNNGIPKEFIEKELRS